MTMVHEYDAAAAVQSIAALQILHKRLGHAAELPRGAACHILHLCQILPRLHAPIS